MDALTSILTASVDHGHIVHVKATHSSSGPESQNSGGLMNPMAAGDAHGEAAFLEDTVKRDHDPRDIKNGRSTGSVQTTSLSQIAGTTGNGRITQVGRHETDMQSVNDDSIQAPFSRGGKNLGKSALRDGNQSSKARQARGSERLRGRMDQSEPNQHLAASLYVKKDLRSGAAASDPPATDSLDGHRKFYRYEYLFLAMHYWCLITSKDEVFQVCADPVLRNFLPQRTAT